MNDKEISVGKRTIVFAFTPYKSLQKDGVCSGGAEKKVNDFFALECVPIEIIEH
jgi:hypothetical protein